MSQVAPETIRARAGDVEVVQRRVVRSATHGGRVDLFSPHAEARASPARLLACFAAG